MLPALVINFNRDFVFHHLLRKIPRGTEFAGIILTHDTSSTRRLVGVGCLLLSWLSYVLYIQRRWEERREKEEEMKREIHAEVGPEESGPCCLVANSGGSYKVILRRSK